MSSLPPVRYRISRLTSNHDRANFDCGVDALNDFLLRGARQNQEVGTSVTHVLTQEGRNEVLGFYSLSASSIAADSVPAAWRRRLPRYPVPTVHLGRLAVSQSSHGLGFGELLLLDAYARVLRASEEIGIAAIDLWAKSDAIRKFYIKFGFESLEEDELHLVAAIRVIRTMMQA